LFHGLQPTKPPFSEFQGQNKISDTQSATAGLTDSLSFLCEVAGGAKDTNVPLPDFEQDFGSAEIDCFPNEGFFGATEEPDCQLSTNNEVSVNSSLDFSYYVGPTDPHI
jgi:hypothetical protein